MVVTLIERGLRALHYLMVVTFDAIKRNDQEKTHKAGHR